MKKLFCALLALIMVLSLAACGSDAGTPATTEPAATELPTEPAVVIEGADKLLSAVWADMGEDEKYYVGGGDYDNMVENDAGLVTNTDYMTGSLHMPEDLVSQADQVASLVHGMNANSMTTGAYHLAEGTDVAAFAQAMRDSIQSARWMCGFPEQLFIASVGGYVVVSFGLTDNIASIENHLTTLYPSAEVLYKEAIEG